jgi:outer membrane protein OmpA-like peptidoglycan-associated protein
MPSLPEDIRSRGRTLGPLQGLLALALTALLSSCASTGGAPSAKPNEGTAASAGAAAPAVAAPTAPPPTPPVPPPPPPILPFDDAVLSAATTLLERAQLSGDAAGGRYDVVIDPLIDGVTGQQSVATRAMGARIVKLIQDAHPKYAVQPFNTAAVKKGPLLLVGTFTGVNAERKTEGQREAFRICLALADLKTGKLVSKGLAFARAEGVDLTPLPPFRDAPAWADDAANNGYIRTCQGTRAGDAINPQYVQRIVASAAIAEAGDAYSAGKYANALKLYQTAASTPGGEQLRTYTGLYLASWRLGRQADASKAFGKIVEQGLETKKLGVKFLFKPSTTVLWSDPKAGPPAPYAMWIREIAKQASGNTSCLGVVGHTSATGSEPINEKLSLQRAEVIGKELVRAARALDQKVIPNGVGSKQTLIGNGRDDQTDALDRRVEFRVVGC